MTRVAAAAFVFALILSPLAYAQTPDPVYESGDARLNALKCGKLPAPLTVDVEIMDNAERFLRLKDMFVKKLRKDGIKVADGAPQTLLLEIETLREYDEDQNGKLLEFRAGQESGDEIGHEGKVYLRGNVWSNRSDSVLGGRKRDPGQLALNQLKVTATINSRANGHCLWQGEVRHNLRGGDPDEAAARVMPILAAAVGKSIRNRSIDIFAPPPR